MIDIADKNEYEYNPKISQECTDILNLFKELNKKGILNSDDYLNYHEYVCIVFDDLDFKISNQILDKTSHLSNELSKINESHSCLEDEIKELESKIDDLESELEESNKHRDFIDTNIQRLFSILNENEDLTFTEQELFDVCLQIFQNKERLTNADIDILKVLANKSLY